MSVWSKSLQLENFFWGSLNFFSSKKTSLLIFSLRNIVFNVPKVKIHLSFNCLCWLSGYSRAILLCLDSDVLSKSFKSGNFNVNMLLDREINACYVIFTLWVIINVLNFSSFIVVETILVKRSIECRSSFARTWTASSTTFHIFRFRNCVVSFEFNRWFVNHQELLVLHYRFIFV